jgi:hypothetical protein
MVGKRGRQFKDSIVDPVEFQKLHGELITMMESEIRIQHLSQRTEETYTNWVKRYICFHEHAEGGRRVRAFFILAW